MQGLSEFTGQYFPWCFTVSPTNKTDCH